MCQNKTFLPAGYKHCLPSLFKVRSLDLEPGIYNKKGIEPRSPPLGVISSQAVAQRDKGLNKWDMNCDQSIIYQLLQVSHFYLVLTFTLLDLFYSL